MSGRRQGCESAPVDAREAAARAAAELVSPGSTIGLGSGRAVWATIAHLKPGTRAVVASERTREIAERAGIEVLELDGTFELDLALDGADEIDDWLGCIKGGGGALLREKIVASASREMIVIADESKYVQRLGRFPLPVEVVDFGVPAIMRSIEAALAAEGCKGTLQIRRRPDGHVFVTDQGHCIIDAGLAAIPDARSLARRLAEIAGVVEHGLFIGLARRAILAGPSGVRIVEKA